MSSDKFLVRSYLLQAGY